ncbi:MAG TPA: GNAT family N-acetyltransferase [Candidatus Limnocylindrales bacterium]|nr:GNAT family N-acetyltransferase [Candidatus Limnocylindrales bacterium]
MSEGHVDLTVRDATDLDVEAIRGIAATAWRDTYATHLRPETIEAFLARSYSAERVVARIARDTFLVAVEDGAIIAFADALAVDDHVRLFAIYALPSSRGRGAGSALLAELQARYAGSPIAAEVLVGNRKGEGFYEARGFVPRETIEAELLGERVVERRWWLPPA